MSPDRLLPDRTVAGSGTTSADDVAAPAYPSRSLPSEPRRRFLEMAGSLAALSGTAGLLGAGIAQAAPRSSVTSVGRSAVGTVAPGGRIELPRLHAESDPDLPAPPPSDAPQRRVGFALVGLGDLTIKQLVPAFAKSRHARITALVSGDRAKALVLAEQLGLGPDAVLDYAGYDRLADRRDVDAVFIVLPNSMHAEFTVRAARAGKHVLCEKPMANTAAECRQMIGACAAAQKKLMVAYRQQYEPHNRLLLKLVRAGELGKLKGFIASNSQNQGRPDQWRLKKALAGGGPLPDIGLYCSNAARFLTGEEPVEVRARITQNRSDPRFVEVEEAVQFELRFPSGLLASAHSSYAAHKSQFLRLEGETGFAELDPAFAYNGTKLRVKRLLDGRETTFEPELPPKDQFTLEIDHFAQCIRNDRRPHTPGEEGLQDQIVIEAIYAAAASGRPVAIAPPPGPTRGPEPEEDA